MAENVDAQVAVVTGAAGGLGAAVVRELSKSYRVVVGVDVDAGRISDAVGSGIGGLIPVAADLSQWDEAEAVVARTVADHGRVDALVNCAAILQRTELDDVDEETFAKVFNTNCRSVFLLSRAALRDMEKRGWGRIVNVTSVGVRVGGYSLTSAVYEATKGAVMNFTMTFANYAASRGILVNSVAPGGMRTQMLTSQTPAELLERVEGDIPVGRLAEPEEIAGLIRYLATAENTYVSGASLDINGGVAMG